MRPSRCLPAPADLLRSGTSTSLCRSPRVFLAEHLAVADDRVERRAQLVAHVGEELRLVLAGDLELATLSSISWNSRAF